MTNVFVTLVTELAVLTHLAAPLEAPGAGAFPEVPVIPEADSLALLLGGLATLALRAGWRRRGARPCLQRAGSSE